MEDGEEEEGDERRVRGCDSISSFGIRGEDSFFLLQKQTDEDLRARGRRKNLHKQFGLFAVQFALGEQTNSSEGQEKKNNLIWEQHLPSVFLQIFSPAPHRFSGWRL